MHINSRSAVTLARIRILLADPTLDNLTEAQQLLALVVSREQTRVLALLDALT